MRMGLIRYNFLHKTYRDCIMLREKCTNSSAMQKSGVCHFRISETPAYMSLFQEQRRHVCAFWVLFVDFSWLHPV